MGRPGQRTLVIDQLPLGGGLISVSVLAEQR
jgi:hypothetical protein